MVFDAGSLKGSLCESVQPDLEVVRRARAHRQRSVAAKATARQNARFANAEGELAGLLPATFDEADCWHVISNGDIDALSYAKHILAGADYQAIVLSTWAISMPAIEYLQAQFNAGRVRRIDAYVGEIMPRDRINQFAALASLVAVAGGRVMTLRTHAKVWLFLADDGRSVVFETSANANYNKRIEQTVISASRQVADTYKRFLDGLTKPTPSFPDWTPHVWPPA